MLVSSTPASATWPQGPIIVRGRPPCVTMQRNAGRVSLELTLFVSRVASPSKGACIVIARTVRTDVFQLQLRNNTRLNCSMPGSCVALSSSPRWPPLHGKLLHELGPHLLPQPLLPPPAPSPSLSSHNGRSTLTGACLH